MAKGQKATIPDRVVHHIVALLDGYLNDTARTEQSLSALRETIPAEAAYLFDGVLADKRISYRDGLLIQTSFGLEDASRATLHTLRPEGGRSVAAQIGAALAERHIAAVRDAYQNIGKNTDVLARGNVAAFDDALAWLDAASKPEREAALSYCLAKVALTARNVLPCPTIKVAALTFHSLALLLDALFRTPSGGAYQQYATAAFLHALIEEAGQGGPNGLRVETKRLNATDASPKVAGDIQILRGNRIEEAFEVTANNWRLKVKPAVDALRSADLARVHILAAVEAEFPANSDELAKAGADVTVIDVATFLRTLAGTMRKPARAAALVRLYELLDRYQPDIERVNGYVRLLQEHELVN